MFLTTELNGRPMTTDGFFESTDCTAVAFWSACSASEVSAVMVLILLPSTPPASSMSCSASFMVETFEGPRYAAVPVSGNETARNEGVFRRICRAVGCSRAASRQCEHCRRRHCGGRGAPCLSIGLVHLNRRFLSCLDPNAFRPSIEGVVRVKLV